MADPFSVAMVVAATFVAVIVPFVVVPEVFERYGYSTKAASVRAIVWVSFLAIVFVPAVATGFIFTVRNLADWFLAIGFLVVAILYDYYRLNPEKIPWARPRA